MMQKLLSRAWLPLLLGAVAFAAYAPSLKSGFVFDARREILQEGFVTSLSNLPAVLSFKVLHMEIMLGPRPGQLLYLMLNAAFYGREPFGYHLSSNLLHAVNVALLFVLLRRLVSTEVAAEVEKNVGRICVALIAVTLLFALHPIAVESVAEVSYSSSLLVCFFTLLALLAATAFHPGKPRAVLMGCAGTFCAFAAVTCKESGLATALLLIVYWFLFRRGEAKGPWVFFLGAANFLMMAFLAARFLFAAAHPLHVDFLGGSFFQVFLHQPPLWVYMMGKLVWPSSLFPFYTYQEMGTPSLAVALAVLFTVVSLQGWLAFKSRMGALGAAIYWMGLMAVSNFFPMTIPVADRFYYLPLAGISMQFLALLLLALNSRRLFWFLVAPLFLALIPLTLLSLRHEALFSSELFFWRRMLETDPDSSIASNGLGTVLLEEGRVDEASAEFSRALELNPAFSDAHFDLGYVFLQRKQSDAAIAQFLLTLKFSPYYPGARSNLGLALMQKGDIDGAIAQYREALRTAPQQAGVYNNLGIALAKKKQTDEAIVQYQKSLQLDPGMEEAYGDLGMALIEKKQPALAMAEFRKAVELNPNRADSRINLGIALVPTSLDGAIVQFRKALEIEPGNASAHNYLGLAFGQKGEIDGALDQFQQAVALDPATADYHNNLGLALAQKGQVDQAEGQFQEAVRLQPDFTAAQLNLTKARKALGQK